MISRSTCGFIHMEIQVIIFSRALEMNKRRALWSEKDKKGKGLHEPKIGVRATFCPFSLFEFLPFLPFSGQSALPLFISNELSKFQLQYSSNGLQITLTWVPLTVLSILFNQLMVTRLRTMLWYTFRRRNIFKANIAVFGPRVEHSSICKAVVQLKDSQE